MMPNKKRRAKCLGDIENILLAIKQLTILRLLKEEFFLEIGLNNGLPQFFAESE